MEKRKKGRDKLYHYHYAGFTLLELLIVIFVITILVSVIVPRFKGIQEEGDIVAAKGDLNTVKTALESYYLHNREYPDALTKLLEASPRIINTVPEDRFNSGNYYNYDLPEDGYYIVWSNGPNKQQDFQLNTSSSPLRIDKATIKDDILVTNIIIE